MAEHMNLGQQFNDDRMLKLDETIELIITFYNMFLTTGDDEYIDTSITLAIDLSELPGYHLPVFGLLVLALTDIKAGQQEDLIMILRSLSQVPAESIGEGANTPSAVYQLSRLYTRRYDECGGREELDKAIQQTEEALGETLVGDPNRLFMLQELGRLAFVRFEELGFVMDLEKSIQCTENAVAATPADHPDRAARLGKLGVFLGSRYERLGNLQDLEDAIQRTNEALAATPADHPNFVAALSNLGTFLGSRYKRLRTLQDLEDAIQRTNEALAATPADHPDRAARLGELGGFLGSRYERLGNLQDLEDAIQRSNEALAATPADHPDRAGRLGKLGGFLRSRYERLGNLQDLEDAIQRTNEALAATPADHPNCVAALSNLGTLLGSRYKRLRTLQDLEDAIQRTNEALAATPADHPDRAARLGKLGGFLNSRYERLRNLQDLEDAIQRTNEALAATPADHPNRAMTLANLGAFLNFRYNRLGNLQDLEDAIQRTNEALAVDPSRAKTLANLGGFLGSRYKRLGTLQDLEDAIQRTNEALAVDPSRAKTLANLGGFLGSRYERLGTLQDLEDAIQRTNEALAVDPSRAKTLANLGGFLGFRYKRLGTLQDLEDAIQRTNEALAATPAGHPDYAMPLGNMGSLLSSRYKRLGNLQDLEDAIQWTNEALAATPADHPDRAITLTNLGGILGSRYERLGTLQDLEDAIQRTNEALAATPADHPYRVTILALLSRQLFSRYTGRGDFVSLARWPSIKHEHSVVSKDLEKAITLAEEVVAMTPANHPDQGHHLGTLGHFIGERYFNTGNKQELLYALGVNQDAWSCSLSAPRIRIQAARTAASILSLLARWQESSSLLEDVVKLLPAVSPRFFGRNDQEHRVSQISNIATLAISAALAAGKPASHCLTLLELGRGIINGLIMDCRSDISDLKSKNPDVFERFDRLRIELDTRTEYDQTTYEQVLKRRMEAAKELEETLVNIRQLPGFSGFQSPPNPTDLMAAAQEGSIIIVNCTSLRSDAILVSKSVIKSLPLPLLSYDEACTRMENLRKNIIRGLNSTYRARNRELNQFLLWLWNTIVGPIFQELQLNPVAEDSTPPRIWWIGVGPLSMAPFHAAGDHSEGSTDNTISRAISSYISTIKALSFAREKGLGLLSRANSKVLLIPMPRTPGESPLGSASAEASDIARAIEQSTCATVLEHPSASEVLEKLQSCEAVHFACHGITDARNPSNSRLLLFKDNGSAAATADPLTVEKMSSTRIKTGQIAYLSACSTVDNVSEDLADESIHIASGFQLAGFSHVLGTMWKSNDVACREVAVAFYRSLLDGQGDKGHGKVSLSFHQAVKALRQKRLRQPIIWTSFIHTGA